MFVVSSAPTDACAWRLQPRNDEGAASPRARSFRASANRLLGADVTDVDGNKEDRRGAMSVCRQAIGSRDTIAAKSVLVPNSRAADLERVFAGAIEGAHASGGIDCVDVGLLALLARAVRCQWATYWKVSAEEMRLHPAIVWSESGVTAEQLKRGTHDRKLSLSEGTAGHVWRSRKPVWTTNISLDMCLPRSIDATGAGLHGGVWFALKTDEAVYGVIELLGRHLDPASDETLVAIEQLGISLGRLIEIEHLRAIQAPKARSVRADR
jgi:hypothetical protein